MMSGTTQWMRQERRRPILIQGRRDAIKRDVRREEAIQVRKYGMMQVVGTYHCMLGMILPT